jgi:spore maturation protein CgeB
MRRIRAAEVAAPAPPKPAAALRIVFFGLSITSSWGNGHATTYRGLVRELVTRGNDVLFLERDVPWYATARDLPAPPWGRTALYASLAEMRDRHERDVRDADIVIVGSYVPEGVALGEWVRLTAGGVVAFYDIDTPITLAQLARNDSEYLSRSLVRRYDLYLSFTGGPTLRRIARRYGSPMVRPLYCSVDPWVYFPQPQEPRWDVGYMGTYSADRQPPLERMLADAAREWPEGRFVVAGPLYPPELAWPANVERIEHLPATEHRAFYNAQRFALNITRADMIAAGYSPSVRLFEAAACGVPIISDWWDGIDTILEPDTEILIAHSAADTLRYAREMSEPERRAIGQRARARVLSEHTSAHRAAQLERYATTLLDRHEVASQMPAS